MPCEQAELDVHSGTTCERLSICSISMKCLAFLTVAEFHRSEDRCEPCIQTWPIYLVGETLVSRPTFYLFTEQTRHLLYSTSATFLVPCLMVFVSELTDEAVSPFSARTKNLSIVLVTATNLD